MSAPTTMDHRIFHQAWLGGRAAPGVYRVVNPAFPDRYDLITVPRRSRKWARTGRGQMWHHVRCAYVRWNAHISRSDLPRIVIKASCGLDMHTNRAGTPILAESPSSPVCGGCARALDREVAA